MDIIDGVTEENALTKLCPYRSIFDGDKLCVGTACMAFKVTSVLFSQSGEVPYYRCKIAYLNPILIETLRRVV